MEQKRMIAKIPADPKHCPKCGSALAEEEEPELHCIEGGNDVTIGGETTFYCLDCQTFWSPHQIPDHRLYDPTEDAIDPTECPHCHAHVRQEIDVEPHKGFLTYVYACKKCGRVWNITKKQEK